jgi:hypothetical protein
MLTYRLLLLLLISLLASSPLIADIYKWTDRNGHVHFSDIPKLGAEKITLPNTQTYTLKERLDNNDSSSLKEDTNKVEDYTVTIAQPLNNATIRNNQGYVSIITETKPQLAKSDKIQLIFDGQPLSVAQKSSIFALSDVNRGSHTIVVNVVDAKGQTLSTSDNVIFFVHRAKVGMRPSQ